MACSTEVTVGPVNGLEQDSVVSCDNIMTIPVAALRERLGYLLPAQEPALAEAIRLAFDLA